MNKWIGHGRLTRDPNVRYTQSGKAVATFTLAVDRRKGKNAPQNAPTADFISCVAWDTLAQTIQSYCGKGKELAVEAHLQTRTYEKNGVKHYVTEAIVENMDFCGSRNDGGAPQQQASNQQGVYPQDAPEISDEEVPF